MVHRVRPDFDQTSFLQTAYLFDRERPVPGATPLPVDPPRPRLGELPAPFGRAEWPQEIIQGSIELLAGSLALGPGFPTAVALEILLGVFGRLAQLPFVSLAFHPQVHLLWQGAWLQQQPVQLVPPELPLLPDKPRGDKDGRRHCVALEQGLGVEEVVEVSVIEGNYYAAVGQPAVTEPSGQFSELHRVGVLAQHFEVLGQAVRLHGQTPGVGPQICDPVVEQDQGSPLGPATESSGGPTQPCETTHLQPPTSGLTARRVIRSS